MDVDGLCGDPTCAVRVAALLALPGDPRVREPCDRCAVAATAALTARQETVLRGIA